MFTCLILGAFIFFSYLPIDSLGTNLEVFGFMNRDKLGEGDLMQKQTEKGKSSSLKEKIDLRGGNHGVD